MNCRYYYLILLISCFIHFNVYAQVSSNILDQYVYLVTKDEAARGVQIGCKCYQKVEWKAGGATISGLSTNQKLLPSPIVKPTKTEIYDLYAFEGTISKFKERYTVVVIDLKISIKETNVSDVMRDRTITFMGELLNIGDLEILKTDNVKPPTSIVNEWELNGKTPSLSPNTVSKLDAYKLMGNSKSVQKMITTKNDENTNNLIDKWDYTFKINFRGRNCTGIYEKSVTSKPILVNVYKLWITQFRDASSNKDWKVVVGKDIEKKHSASPDCKNIMWEMPDLLSGTTNKTWNIQMNGSKSKSY
jgi:hypothetical protein